MKHPYNTKNMPGKLATVHVGAVSVASVHLLRQLGNKGFYGCTEVEGLVNIKLWHILIERTKHDVNQSWKSMVNKHAANVVECLEIVCSAWFIAL